MRQNNGVWPGIRIAVFFAAFWTTNALAASTCDKPAEEEDPDDPNITYKYVWTHAFYYDKNEALLQIEQLKPQQNMSDRILKKIGNKDIPVCSVGPYDDYFCPSNMQVPINGAAAFAIYYARREDSTEVAAYCRENVKNVYREIKCAANDPSDDGGTPACTFCYCMTRPCPPPCCH